MSPAARDTLHALVLDRATHRDFAHFYPTLDSTVTIVVIPKKLIKYECHYFGKISAHEGTHEELKRVKPDMVLSHTVGHCARCLQFYEKGYHVFDEFTYNQGDAFGTGDDQSCVVVLRKKNLFASGVDSATA